MPGAKISKKNMSSAKKTQNIPIAKNLKGIHPVQKNGRITYPEKQIAKEHAQCKKNAEHTQCKKSKNNTSGAKNGRITYPEKIAEEHAQCKKRRTYPVQKI
jgi:hypothetical protein